VVLEASVADGVKVKVVPALFQENAPATFGLIENADCVAACRMTSENVTETGEVTGTPVAPLDGEKPVTCGAVVSAA
jgi:hypothetical protein